MRIIKIQGKKKLVLPRRFIKIEKGKTVALMNSGGQMQGRVKTRGASDGTSVMRVRKSVDVDKDGVQDWKGGTIVGRKKTVRSSKRARGYVRRL